MPDFGSEVPFDRNLSSSSVAWGNGTWNDYYGCQSSNDFWTELVVAAFQPAEGADGDPDMEAIVFGSAKAYGDDNQCVIYYESLADSGVAPSSDKTLAHEVGHGAGIVDNACKSGCLMWTDEYSQLGDYFCDWCLLDMRMDSNY